MWQKEIVREECLSGGAINKSLCPSPRLCRHYNRTNEEDIPLQIILHMRSIIGILQVYYNGVFDVQNTCFRLSHLPSFANLLLDYSTQCRGKWNALSKL